LFISVTVAIIIILCPRVYKSREQQQILKPDTGVARSPVQCHP